MFYHAKSIFYKLNVINFTEEATYCFKSFEQQVLWFFWCRSPDFLFYIQTFSDNRIWYMSYKMIRVNFECFTCICNKIVFDELKKI